MEVANTLAYYDTAKIIAVNSFIVQAPGLIRHLWQLKTVVFLHWCLIRAALWILNEIRKMGT
jgi:hypothetical protein